jgi:hypothetical protein
MGGSPAWTPGPLRLTRAAGLLKRLEAAFPRMEDPATGTKVSIGVAS